MFNTFLSVHLLSNTSHTVNKSEASGVLLLMIECTIFVAYLFCHDSTWDKMVLNFELWIHKHRAHIFMCCRVSLQAPRIGILEAKLAAYLHPVALQWAYGSNERVQHRGSISPPATQWPEVASWACATGGGSVEASGLLLEARTSDKERQEAQRKVRW